jgi:outer membrane protein TolC
MQSTTKPGGGGSVNLINSFVQVQGQYSGSTPGLARTAGVLSLTLKEALAFGLRYNLGAISETQTASQTAGQRQVARSNLLPHLNTVISEEVERLNLRTQGVESSSFPLTAQFNFFDARAARLRQTVVDFVQLNNLRSATEDVEASLKAVSNARDLVVLAVSGSYLQLIAANARIVAAAAQVESSRAIFQQASDRLSSGLNARIDATRSQVQLQIDQQRLRSLQADRDTQKLRLARVIGLAPGQEFTVTEEYPYSPLSGMGISDALTNANHQRADLQSAEASVRAAQSAVKAARSERLPSLMLNADWGVAGLRPTASAHSVYSVYGTLNIPLYQGGRVRGDVQQANAALQQREAELEDLRSQVDQDVCQSFINLNAAADQVGVAQSNVTLSHDTLSQARDRFSAGIADTVELVQAEQSVVQADNDYISAVFEHNLAKVSLARAMGNTEQTLPQLLKK